MLYLHTSTGMMGEHGGVNLMEFCEYLGIADCVAFADQHDYLIGYPEARLVDLYRGMDVLMNVSLGEGFGIPILEAQACGTPVIVGDWTSMGELCFGGWAIPKSEAQRIWTPIAAWQWSVNPAAVADALGMAYRANLDSKRLSARRGMAAYDADRVTREIWKPVLEGIERRIQAAVPSSLAEVDSA
jgi:glycosyltransferase involved in cell wall biosynthesis